jgi:signal transduction histidine kinase
MNPKRTDSQPQPKYTPSPGYTAQEGRTGKWQSLSGTRLLIAGIAVLVVAAAYVSIRDPFDFDDRPHIQRLVKLAANSVQADLAEDMQARIFAQVRLARLGKLREIPAREWEVTANSFLTHHPGYLGLQLLDKTYRTERSAALPDEGNLASAANVLADIRMREMLQSRISSTDEQALMATITLPNGKLEYVIIVPSFAGQEQDGFLLAVCDIEKTLDSMLAEFKGRGFYFAVLDGSHELYRVSSNADARRSWSESAHVPLSAVDWRVEVWPSPEMLAEASSRLPELGAIFVLLLVLLLASTIHLALRLQVQSLHLRAARTELEERVQERTAELREANERLRSLSAHLLSLQDEERRRIARELHDSTAQSLSALKMNISSLKKLTALDGHRSRTLLEQSSQLAEQALTEIRSLSYLLHPPVLEDFGLESALTWYAQGFRERSGIQVEADIDPDLGRFAPDLELILFRIVQEALSNIHRHSGSLTASIVLSRTDSEVTLLVTDQGCGLPNDLLDPKPGSVSRVGVGITGMRERVRQAGGKLEIGSTHEGTTITVVLPASEHQPVAIPAA